jgi:hypothetical protein
MTIRTFALGMLALTVSAPVHGQSSMQPTPPPAVTAENAGWYLSGDPIAFGRNIYYPAGAVIHFLRNEMVMTGMFDGVPIYARTTHEPGSIIYVPLAGGVMRPYERRRTGELAGTVGSTTPSFPVVLPSDPASRVTPAYVQAPPDTIGRAVGTSGFIMSGPASAPAPAPEPIGTAGSIASEPAAAGPLLLATGRRPLGLNGAFLEFGGARWFASGPTVEFAADRFEQIGEHRGFTVYAARGARDVIYVPSIAGSPGLMTPYTQRP